MMSRFTHTKVARICIFVILGVDDGGNDIAYVDKTTSSDLSRILRNHRKGKNHTTSDDFKEGALCPNPSIHVLEVLKDVSPATAFRHVLAWAKHFENNQYIMLLHPKVEKMIDNLSPHTETILQEIMKRSIQEVLANPPALDTEEANQMDETSASKRGLMQLNMRVSQDEKKAFADFCASKNLTQREGLVYLMANVNSDASATLISEQREVILNQAKYIRALQKTIAMGSRGANADKKLKHLISCQQQAVKEYFRRILPGEIKEPMLKCFSWERHLAVFPNHRQYEYPQADGFAVIKLEAICYGHGRYPAVFIWGTTLEEDKPRKIRLRSYAKKEYFGIPVGGNPQSYKGAQFLVAYRVSSDGAADLYAAYPMDIFAHPDRSSEPKEKKHPSLEDQIRNATCSRK